MTSKTPIIAAADGSALGNPGPAGWAWYIDGQNWASGGWDHGTNNMGELMAVLDLFRATEPQADRPLKILCDSQYAINCISKWMPGWKKKGWKKADGKPVLNQDILKELDAAIRGRDYEFEWVKGHAGHELNEIADDLARAAATAHRDGKEPDAGPGFVAERAGESGAPRAVHIGEEAGEENGEETDTSDALEQELLLLKPEVYSRESTLAALLAPDFLWITPAGRRADRATVLEHRERAFVTRGEPVDVSSQVLDEHTHLVLSQVETARGQVLRSSLWARDAKGSWRLRFRQETAVR